MRDEGRENGAVLPVDDLDPFEKCRDVVDETSRDRREIGALARPDSVPEAGFCRRGGAVIAELRVATDAGFSDESADGKRREDFLFRTGSREGLGRPEGLFGGDTVSIMMMAALHWSLQIREGREGRKRSACGSWSLRSKSTSVAALFKR